MNIKDMKGALPHKKERKEPAPARALTTVWGEALDPDHVWEDYPRPRMVRSACTMLNGIWSYGFTSGPDRPEQFDGTIVVPFSPESPLSGVNRQLQPDEFLWYERSVSVPAAGAGERCLLHFEAVDQSAVIYVNGREVMRHTGGYLPFTVDISGFLNREDKEFTLAVRVQDLSDTSFHSRGKQKLQPGGMYYTAQSGIWQSVWMEVVPRHYLEDVLFETQPDLMTIQISLLDNESDAELTAPHTRSVRNGGEYCQGRYEENPAENALRADRSDCTASDSPAPVTIFVYEPTDSFDGAEALYHTKPILTEQSGSRQLTLTIPRPRLWAPASPWLYPVEVRMGEDRVRTYLAVRTFGTAKGADGHMHVLLNGKPVFLNGILDQGYWPDGLYTAPSDDALQYDIEQMKALGFNMLRKHAKIECRRWYYHCDRLGMIVWQDMVNGGGNYSALLLTYLPTGLCVPGPRSRRQNNDRPPVDGKARKPSIVERLEYRITARRDPEGREEFRRECTQTIRHLRGHPSIMTWVIFNEGWGQFETKAMTDYVRLRDPMRLIDSASGWFEHKTGDFKSVHNYFRKLGVPKDVRANVLSEYGGYVYHIEGHSVYETTYGYHTCSSAEEFERSFLHLMTEEVFPLCEQGLCGAVYTQVSDIEEETNGLLTYDRRIRKISESGARRLRQMIMDRSLQKA